MQNRTFNFPCRAVVVLTAILLMGQAQAHAGTGLRGGFALGFVHPFDGFDHLLAMICVGLWGAFLGRPLVYVLPVAFPIMMVVGALFGMFGIELPVPPVEQGIATSVIVLGGCIALAWRAPLWVACAIVAVFALFHGYAHGVMLPAAADPVGYSLGFVFATGLLHVAGIALGLLNHWPKGVITTRAIGASVGVAGLWLLYATSGI